MIKPRLQGFRGRQTCFYVNNPSRRARNLWSYVESIGCARCSPGFQTERPGTRTGYLLHYVRAGELKHVVKGRRFAVSGGSACLLDVSSGHRQLNTSRRTTQLWWVLFRGQDMLRVFTELGADVDPVFPLSNHVEFEALFHELWSLTVQQPANYEVKSHLVLQHLIAELFIDRAEKLRGQSLIPDEARLSEPVRLAVSLMEHCHHFKTLHLKHLAQQARLSIYHFVHKFHAECGMSPMQYLCLYRIEQAKGILRTTSKSIREVSELVGMRNANYFANRFRRVVGVSPQQYRRQSLKHAAQPSARNTQTHN